MKTAFSGLLLFALCFAFALPLSAQDKKALEKEWKKKIKAMSVEEFKEIYEGYGKLKGQSASFKRQYDALSSQVMEQQSLMTSKDEQLESLQKRLAELREDCAGRGGSPGGGSGEDYSQGVVYKVQIGAFRNKSLQKHLEKGSYWLQDEDGSKKYTIGNFRDYWEADNFKKYIRDILGIKDAWIVAYENNRRKDIQETSGMGTDN